MNTKPTTEERIWAAVSHLSAIALGMGIAIPILGWSEQRHKSRYASFQCLQALGYQSLGYTIWVLSYLVLVILFSFVFIFAAARATASNTMILAWTGMFMLLLFGFFGLYLLLPVIAAIACGFGKDFHYPILGKRLAGYLGYGISTEPVPSGFLDEEHEYRWVASMGHFSVIIVFWGLLAPLTTWIVQGRRSAFLKFQSVQTTIYQGMVNLFYLGAMISWLGTIPLFFVMGSLESPGQDSSTAMPGLALFFIAMLIGVLILLALPLFHLLGQWAGYRLLKGEDYCYPLLGKLLQKRMMRKEYRVSQLAGDFPGASSRSPKL